MTNAYKETFYFRSLTDGYVFCPKCGTKNQFRLSSSSTELNYFCERCSEKLNDYWEGVYTGQIEIALCNTCQQSTFKELKYCVSCGSIQRLVAHKRAKKISKALGEDQLTEDLRKAAFGDEGIFTTSSRYSKKRILLSIFLTIIVAVVAGVIYLLIVIFF